MPEKVMAPRQRRSRESLRRIVGAVEALLQEEGFRQATVVEICRRSGCSVGSFYARFRDKEAALHYVHEQMCERAGLFARQMLDPERWKGVRLEEVLQRYLRLLVRNYLKNRGLLRAGMLLGQQTGSLLFNERARGVEQETAALTIRLFRRHRGEIAGEPERAASLFQRVVRGALIGEVLFADPPAEEADLLADLSGIVTAVLGPGAAGRPA